MVNINNTLRKRLLVANLHASIFLQLHNFCRTFFLVKIWHGSYASNFDYVTWLNETNGLIKGNTSRQACEQLAHGRNVTVKRPKAIQNPRPLGSPPPVRTISPPRHHNREQCVTKSSYNFVVTFNHICMECFTQGFIQPPQREEYSPPEKFYSPQPSTVNSPLRGGVPQDMCVAWNSENCCITVWVLTGNCVLLQAYWIRILGVYGNFEYWTLDDELFIMMKVTEKWDMLALHGVGYLVNSCYRLY